MESEIYGAEKWSYQAETYKSTNWYEKGLFSKT